MTKRKKFYEVLCCFLHPVAVGLIWINLLLRKDLAFGAKLIWGVMALVPLVPFLYVLRGHELW